MENRRIVHFLNMRHKLKAMLCTLLLAGGCRAGHQMTGVEPVRPVRIVSTAPALTELVCAVGASDCLVGRTDICDYPPEVVKPIPAAGKFAMPNVETVLALKPTHLLESFLVNPVHGSMLERSGISVEHINCARIAEIPQAVRRVGELTGHTGQASVLAERLETGVRALEEARRMPEECPRTLILLDHLTPVTCGTNTFISEMVSLAGGNNIAFSLRKEYDTVSLEWIIERKPQLILCFYEITGDPLEHFSARTGWKNIPAVKAGRIAVPRRLDLICRPGPRFLEGIEELRKCIDSTLDPSSPTPKAGLRPQPNNQYPTRNSQCPRRECLAQE